MQASLNHQIRKGMLLIKKAELELGELSEGQRRDLLRDNTDWSIGDINKVVNIISEHHGRKPDGSFGFGKDFRHA